MRPPRRTTTGLALVGLLVAVTLGNLASASSHTSASNAGSPDLLQIPLRWCAVRGTTAVTNPGAFGEPDTDSVLWRRHERPTDGIWTPGARITFRSAITSAIGQNANFPIIDDPSPPPTGPGQLGDILDLPIDNTEIMAVVASCQQAWDALANQNNTVLRGPIAVNIGRLVDQAGNPTNTWGWGSGQTLTFNGPNPDVCVNPGGFLSAEGGWVVAVDFSVTGNAVDDRRLIGHELGHVLRLGHGNGLDDDGDGRWDTNCDADEANNNPPTVMHPFINNGNDTLTGLQSGRARAIARISSGSQIDPPAVLLSGDTIGDQGSDAYQDVARPSYDLTWAGLSFNRSRESAAIVFSLFGLLEESEENEYVAFLDLDNDPSTGGEPAALGFPTQVAGIELVAQATTRGRFARPTVWQFDGSAFVDVTGDSTANVDTPPIEDDLEAYNVVSVEVSVSLTGLPTGTVPFQAIAKPLNAADDVDVLPGAAAAAPSPDLDLLEIVPLLFPVCAATPFQVFPGDTVTVEAAGFNRSGEPVHVILGDTAVADGVLDAQGETAIDFQIPPDSRQGLRLITIGIDGTALTADCAVQVGEAEDVTFATPAS